MGADSDLARGIVAEDDTGRRERVLDDRRESMAHSSCRRGPDSGIGRAAEPGRLLLCLVTRSEATTPIGSRRTPTSPGPFAGAMVESIRMPRVESPTANHGGVGVGSWLAS